MFQPHKRTNPLKNADANCTSIAWCPTSERLVRNPGQQCPNCGKRIKP